MALTSGTRLGPYEIICSLGVGGMGEVYRGRDAKLNRDVALKVLPDLLANDPDRLARFRREAQVLASLNHPNIAHIYGFEETGATNAIVMELVEGPTLAVLIQSRSTHPGSISELLEWALPIARQVADALEMAHDSGIIHRDLKPANIKVRDDGTVKVLDFGLAKALSTDAGAIPGASPDSPTLTARGTQMGMILGTAAYMAPEQARGRTVDRRADIWAFGVVLYEMLSGKRAFEGEDVSITLASVLKEDVDWQALPPDLPAPIRRLLRRCLEKDPKRRLSAIGDARLELDESASAPSTDAPNAETAAVTAKALADVRRSARRAWMTAAAIATVAVLLAAASLGRPEAAPAPLQRAQFVVAEGDSLAAISGPSLSPDGRLLAFVGRSQGGGSNQIFVRPLDALDAHAIAGTEGAASLFWIEGSKAIGYAVGDRLYLVGADGGRPQQLCDLGSFAGGTWLPSGDILLAQFAGANARLFRVSAQGGVPVEVARQNGNESATAYVSPAWLPGTTRFLYLGWSLTMGERALYAGSLDGAPPVRLVASDSWGVYAEPGFLLFVRGSTLFAQRFDASSLKVSGEPTRVADSVAMNTLTGGASFAVSQTGVLAYRTAVGAASLSDLAWLDRTGKTLGTVGDARNYSQLRLSPDGRRVAVSEANRRLSVLDLGNGVASGLTDAATTASDPVWSPDSETLAFDALQKTVRQIYTQRVGSPTPTVVFESAEPTKWLDDWSADGKFLLFHLPRPSKLFAVEVAAPKTAQFLTETSETIDGAHFSPDGKWVAYQMTEAGVYQVWVAAFPAFDKRRRVSPQGGGQAFWRGDGRELFYLTPAGKMMSVAVTPNSSNGTLDFAAPVEMFQSPFTNPNLTIDLYSVTKDGKRFLFIRPREATGVRPPVTVVVNWAADLAIAAQK